jgi:hypothetical protein
MVMMFDRNDVHFRANVIRPDAALKVFGSRFKISKPNLVAVTALRETGKSAVVDRDDVEIGFFADEEKAYASESRFAHEIAEPPVDIYAYRESVIETFITQRSSDTVTLHPGDVPLGLPGWLGGMNRASAYALIKKVYDAGGVALVPFSRVCRMASETLNSIGFHDGFVTRRGVSEPAFDPEEFLPMRSYDLKTYLTSNLVDDDLMPTDDWAYSDTDDGINLYFVVTRRPSKDTKLQTWKNGYSMYNKLLSTHIKTWLGHNQDEGVVLRQWVLSNLFGGVPITEAWPTGYVRDVTGAVRLDGRVQLISASGHLVNLLLASEFTAIDWEQAVVQIEGNVRQAMGEKVPGAHHPSEDAKHGLWHNQLDYEVAIYTYIFTAIAFGLRVQTEAVDIINRGLSRIGNAFPLFRRGESFVSKDFRRSGNRIPDVPGDVESYASIRTRVRLFTGMGDIVSTSLRVPGLGSLLTAV